MPIRFLILATLALSGCAATVGSAAPVASPCAGGQEASWACQIERYQDVNVN